MSARTSQDLPRFWRTPLDEGKKKVPVGEVVIIPERCKGCQWCIEFCPRKVLTLSKRFNTKGYYPPEVVRHGACVDCRLCELLCPDYAIHLKRDLEGGNA